MNQMRAVGTNVALVTMFSALAAKECADLIAIVSVTLALVGGLGWVVSDGRRTERLARIIDACRGSRRIDHAGEGGCPPAERD